MEEPPANKLASTCSYFAGLLHTAWRSSGQWESGEAMTKLPGTVAASNNFKTVHEVGV